MGSVRLKKKRQISQFKVVLKRGGWEQQLLGRWEQESQKLTIFGYRGFIFLILFWVGLCVNLTQVRVI